MATNDNFAKYLANQIRNGQLDLDAVLVAYPNEAERIKEILEEYEVNPTVTGKKKKEV